jgi:SAM-dependent methyltransferase
VVAPNSPVSSSFRDPAGSVFALDGRIFRLVNQSGVADLQAFLASPRARKFVSDGDVARTDTLTETQREELYAKLAGRGVLESREAALVVEHERIPFPSYPYEWAPEMLHSAGMLTLDLAEQLLAEGIGLKDGTPYNVLYRGTQPVFIDLLSFERRESGDPRWLPEAQFTRTFLLPLAANKYFGLPLDQVLVARRDGLEPEEVYRWTGPLQRLKAPFLSLVSLPVWLSSRHNPDQTSIYEKKTLADPEKARFILTLLLRRLRRTLNRVAPAPRKSTWSDYMECNNNYTQEHFQAKERFLQQALEEFPSRKVLDVGCNTGHFSALAARRGASVVAIDYDPVVVGKVWQNARQEKLDILPLVVNLTRPSPGTGWCNRECPSFLERATGSFDLVLMLAVLHHMVVTERVPLLDILSLAADLTTNLLVIEFVGPEDSMFKRLTRGREELHRDLTPAVFEAACRTRFEIIRSQHIEGTSRWLYLLRKLHG